MFHPSVKNSIILNSPAFQEGGSIPAKYTCDGANLSPPLNWSGVPHEAKSFVLICNDPDAAGGEWTHWLLWNLPAPSRKLLEGFSAKEKIANGAAQGANDFKNIGWGGPCPPSGTHRYVFTIYALDTTLQIPATSGKIQLMQAMSTHILAQGQLTGNYARRK